MNSYPASRQCLAHRRYDAGHDTIGNSMIRSNDPQRRDRHDLKYLSTPPELTPSFGGLGATLIDSLDTLFIMGLDEQFQKAKETLLELDEDLQVVEREFGVAESRYRSVALSVGDWFFDRVGVNVVDCPYPCDNTCHNLDLDGIHTLLRKEFV
ncbi:hypothetical protein Scep_016452 [Stephania cephalantha]|uniref:Pectin acetylesterase n=1 Tax=Stephania cephalantha TaxID=152367 RepID=A0AAP0NU67_9MAGN